MQRQIDIELERLRSIILAMGKAVEESIMEATEGLIQRDATSVERVRELETKINTFHLEVDEVCLKTIAAQSPLAADLRMILAIIKINSDLERMGDQAMNIALNVKDYLSKPSLSEDAKALGAMSVTVRKMVRDAMEAFVKSDLALSEAVLIQDDIVDEGKRTTFQSMIKVMKANPDNVEAAVDLMLISRNLERMGDHATNIAEDVIFASTGKDIRHGGYTASNK
jgi:phosphate transport system protein